MRWRPVSLAIFCVLAIFGCESKAVPDSKDGTPAVAPDSSNSEEGTKPSPLQKVNAVVDSKSKSSAELPPGTGEKTQPSSRPSVGVKNAATFIKDEALSSKAVVWNATGDAAQGKRVAVSNCRICHKIDGRSMVGTGPAIDASHTAKLRKKMADYVALAADFKTSNSAQYLRYQKDYEEILAISHPDARLQRWLKTYLSNPKFETGKSKMLPKVLNDKDLEDLVAYLLSL